MIALKQRLFYRTLGVAILIAAIIVLLLFIKSEYGDTGQYPVNPTGVTLCINEVLFANMGEITDSDGDRSDWIEIYNYGKDSVNLLGKSLADHAGSQNRWYFPDYELEAGKYLIIWASAKNKVTSDNEMHSDFLINLSDTITLYDENNNCIDSFHVDVNVDPGISVGRPYKEPYSLAALSNSSPGKANNARPISYVYRENQELSVPSFSKETGVYDSEFELVLSCEDKDAVILYTLDGSVPDEDSKVYETPIKICDRSGEPNLIGNVKTTANYEMNYSWENSYTYKGTVVRARVMKNGELSDTVTNSYFISPETEFDIVSLAVDPEDMFDEQDGLYVPGKTYYVWKKYNKESTNNVFPPANYYSDDKLKGHIQILESDSSILSDNNVEIKITGAASRSNAAKGLKIKMDENKASFDPEIFRVFQADSFNETGKGMDTIILRTSGTDFNKTMFKDILAQSVVYGLMNLTCQAAEPAVLFINGEYFGIHNIREAYGEDYFYRHYGIDPKKLCLLELNTDVSPYAPEITAGKESDLKDYYDLVDYVKNHELSDEKNYEYVCGLIDVDSFMDYYIAEIYYGNDDWPGNNFRIWRADQQGAVLGDNRWRPVFYDLDDAFLYKDINSVEYVLKEDYDRAILENVNLNYDANREIILALMENDGFRTAFFERFEECLDTVFSSERVLEYIDKYQEIYEPEMDDHFKRWHTTDGWLKKIKNLIKYTYSEENLYTKENWEKKVEDMRTFSKERPDILRKYIDEYNAGN